MSHHDDPTETLIVRTLTARAGQAPPDGDLLPRVHGRLRRRRARRATGAVVLACLAVAAAVLTVPTVAGDGAPAIVQEAAAPDGWRWEAYESIEVLAPAAWRDGTTESPYCLEKATRAELPGEVGRPGIIALVACNPAEAPADKRRPQLWFGTREPVGTQQLDAGWVRETRVLGGVRFTVLSDDAAERSRIVDSARLIDNPGGNGCPADHALSQRPADRPVDAGGLGSVGTVRSVTICRYNLKYLGQPKDPGLLQRPTLFENWQVDGAAATALVGAIKAAPEGSGPPYQQPGRCTDRHPWKFLILIVDGSKHDQEVVLRVGPCDRSGTDDGTTKRQLTTQLRQLLPPSSTAN